jgi:DNA-binding transcriptional ArsR family regulator
MSYHVQVTREFACPEIEDVELDVVLSALADPLRRGVIVALVHGDGIDRAGERACSSFALPVAKSTRTYHWRVLREAGLIRQRDAGNGTFVRLREDFETRFPGLLATIVRLGGS